MSEPVARAPDDLVEALESSLGALFADRDVTEVFVAQGATVEVLRRGQRELLDAGVSDDVWQAAERVLGNSAVSHVEAQGVVTLLRLAGDKLALRVERTTLAAPFMVALFEEGFVDEEQASALLFAASAGRSLVVAGPSRAGRMRLVAALARELGARSRVVDVGDRTVDNLLRVAGETPSRRASAASLVGANALCWLEASVDEAAELIGAQRDLTAVCSIVAPRAEGVLRALGDVRDDVVWAVVGPAPDGRPMVLEIGGAGLDVVVPTVVPAQPAGPTYPSRPAAPRVSVPMVAEPEVTLPGRRAPMAAMMPAGLGSAEGPASDLPPLVPLPPGPPDGWASAADDHDPGWELSTGEEHVDRLAGTLDEPTPGGERFAATMDAVRSRPTFQPRPPPAHPQTNALKAGARGERFSGADPLGGLTLEPPGGYDADEAHPHDDGDPSGGER